MSEQAPPVLFSEPGARYRTIAYGPLLCGFILLLEVFRGGALHWFGLLFCSLLLAGFVWLQVVAGKRHISVELTPDKLRQGAQTLALRDIAAVLPEIDEDSWDDEDWESAPALGELTGVPRRRKGIGLKLKSGSVVQAWARDHRVLRAELSAALEAVSGKTGGADKVALDKVDAAEGDEEKEAR